MNIVSFSGGRTSAYLVWLMKDKADKFVFMDTGCEHPATYEFIRNIRKHWGVDITCIRTYVTPEMGIGVNYRRVRLADLKPDMRVMNQMSDKYGPPNCTDRHCTNYTKLIPFRKFKGKGVTTWLGIRCDEPRRLRKKKGVRYLAELSDFDKQDILDWWAEQPFDLGIPEHLGNCVFCVHKSPRKIALAARDCPDAAAEWSQMMGDVPNYRRNLSFNGIIKMFSLFTRQEIVDGMRGDYDDSVCSQSCEVFK